MTETSNALIEALQTDGDAALLALTARQAEFARLGGATPADIAAEAIVALSADDPLRAVFDGACLNQLRAAQHKLRDIPSELRNIEIMRLERLLACIYRILPSKTVNDLHKNYGTWVGFFEQFVFDEGLDLRREFWRILAASQNSIGATQANLTPLWMSICRDCGPAGRYHASYLSVALKGLINLPFENGVTENAEFVALGLAHWAAAQEPDQPEFERQWRAIEQCFDVPPDFWARPVGRAVSRTQDEIYQRSKKERGWPS